MLNKHFLCLDIGIVNTLYLYMLGLRLRLANIYHKWACYAMYYNNEEQNMCSLMMS